MKINNKWPIICGVLLCILMIASDYHGFTTEMAVVEFYCSTINYFKFLIKGFFQIGEVLLFHY